MMPNEFRTPAWMCAPAAWTAVLIATLLSSCAYLPLQEPEPETKPQATTAEEKPPPEPIKPPPPSPLYEWWGGNEYLSRIEVSINEQKARFYAGDKLVGWTTVASGIHKFPTPVGDFAVTEKIRNKKSNLYGKIYNKNGKLVRRNAKMGVHSIPAGGSFKGAPMPFFLRLTNDGIGMHAGPIPRPGNRASHGCIRMPRNFAPILYHHVDIGTPVTIKGNGPAYARYVAKQRKPVSPSAQPVAVPSVSAATAGAVSPSQPALSSAEATPKRAAVPPPSRNMADDPAYTSAYEAPQPPVAAATPAPPALGATSTETAPLYAAPPAPQTSHAPSASGVPLASPAPPTDAQTPPLPPTVTPVPKEPQTLSSEPPAETTKVSAPDAPAQSTTPLAPAPTAQN